MRTIYVSLPRYNIYSERKECEGLGEYAICKRTANTEKITEEQKIYAKKVEDKFLIADTTYSKLSSLQ